MEAGDRAAGDGDKQEREQVAGPYRAGTIDELVSAGIVRVGRIIRMPIASPTMVPIFRKVER